MRHAHARALRMAFSVCLLSLAAATPRLQAQKPDVAAAPNYDLAAQWTPQKVGKLVFDTTVTPRWLESSDRFWYAYQTREGRRFTLVDPVKRTKAPLFDHAKMAATLTSITRIPYDAQHLPFSSGRFVKKDTAFEFDVAVPIDAVIAAPARRETTEQQGAAASRFLLNPGTAMPPGSGICIPATAAACNPAVLDGLRSDNDIRYESWFRVPTFDLQVWQKPG